MGGGNNIKGLMLCYRNKKEWIISDYYSRTVVVSTQYIVFAKTKSHADFTMTLTKRIMKRCKGMHRRDNLVRLFSTQRFTSWATCFGDSINYRVAH